MVEIDPKRLRAINLGVALKQKRKAANMTLEQAAKQIYSSKQVVSDLEAGITLKPDVFLIVQLAKLYGMTAVEFFSLFEE